MDNKYTIIEDTLNCTLKNESELQLITHKMNKCRLIITSFSRIQLFQIFKKKHSPI